MFQKMDRVYVIELARKELGWHPKYDFSHILKRLTTEGKDLWSPLTYKIGIKGYHHLKFKDGLYPV